MHGISGWHVQVPTWVRNSSFKDVKCKFEPANEGTLNTSIIMIANCNKRAVYYNDVYVKYPEYWLNTVICLLWMML